MAAELGNSDAAIALAAARALGKIDTPEAAAALAAARSNAKGDLRRAIDDSCLRVADRLASQGKTSQAADIYLDLCKPQEPRPIRMAALTGVLNIAHDQGGNHPRRAGRQRCRRPRRGVGLRPPLHAGGGGQAGGRAGETSAGPAGRPGHGARFPAVQGGDARHLAGRREPDEQVKTAALEALGGVGDVSVAPVLMEATFAGGKPGAAARHALETIFAPGVDEWLIEKMKSSSDLGRRRLLMEILDRRMAAAAVPALLEDALHKDAATRHAAMTALEPSRRSRRRGRHDPRHAEDGKRRRREEAEREITLVCTRIAGQDEQAGPVLAVFDAAGQSEKDALLPLLGRIGGAAVRQLINAALASSDAHWREVGFTALCNWPESSASGRPLEAGRRAPRTRSIGFAPFGRSPAWWPCAATAPPPK